jgi:UTP:GlnB (protein PII) uridylyltransferase
MAYTKPKLRERLKNKIMAGSKGGKPGQWSARKAQLLTQEYKKAGGGFTGSKTKAQKSLSKWTKEEWGTKSGKPSTQGKEATGERYLPKKAREKLTKKEYQETSRKKREDTKKGKQFSKQPKKIAKKTSRARK